MGEAPVRTMKSFLTISDAIFHTTPPNVIFLGKKTLKSPIKSKRNQRKERQERWEIEDENFTPALP
jgi:hypothetical protein